MSIEDIQKTVDELGKAWSAFQEKNDERLKQIESKGSEDPVTKEQVEKINKELSALCDSKKAMEAALKAEKERGERLEVALKRPGSKEGEKETQRALEKKFINAFARNGETRDLAKFLPNSGEEFKSLSTNVNEAGGYLVMPEFGGILVGQIFDTSPMRQFANVITIGSKSIEVIIDNDEAAGGWVGETGTRSETTTPTFDKKEITAHEVYADPKATTHMLEDAMIDIESWLIGKAADKLARLQNTAFITGTGVNQPRGILTYNDWTTAGTYQFGAIEQFDSGSNGTFSGDNLITITQNVKPAYRAGSVWMMSRATVEDARQLKVNGEANRYAWEPSLQAGVPDRLLGYPIAEAEDMPDPATNALSIAFGNFRIGYQIVDRRGIRILRDPYTAKGFVEFYTSQRVGGDVVNFEAFKILKLAA